MKENTKKDLYESIMQKVSQQVVEMLSESKQLNEGEYDLGKIESLADTIITALSEKHTEKDIKFFIESLSDRIYTKYVLNALNKKLAEQSNGEYNEIFSQPIDILFKETEPVGQRSFVYRSLKYNGYNTIGDLYKSDKHDISLCKTPKAGRTVGKQFIEFLTNWFAKRGLEWH